MTSHEKAAGEAASRLITAKIADLGDWRGDTLARIRTLIREVDPDVVEEWKWMGTPVWSHDGGICTGETYKSTVKLTFFKGASLEDPAGLFNSSLDGKVRRAIDIREGEVIDAKAFEALIRAAVALNTSGGGKGARKSAAKRVAPKPTLLAGGNPQIAKADGDAPVQADITAMRRGKRSDE